jgi:REP element-mobilizing transposase RayT
VAGAAHSQGFAAWFITWNTKYRYKMLAKRSHWGACEAILERACRRHGFKLLALSVMPTTVQLVVVTPHTVSAAECAFLLKGASAKELCEFEPRFHLRYPRGHFWARGYDARPASLLDMQTAINYVNAPHNDPRQAGLA